MLRSFETVVDLGSPELGKSSMQIFVNEVLLKLQILQNKFKTFCNLLYC